jgi:hypothetical protein
MLFVSELVIKYGFKRYLSYSEADGDIFYVSPYPRNTIGNIIMGKLKGKTIFERTVNEPNDIDGLERSEYSYAHRYNKLGLRGKLPDQLPDSIKAKTTLLLTLGDSFTEGMGAPEDSTWIALLEHYLNKQGDKCCPYFGVNGGVIGAEPVMEYKVLERLAESYRFRDVFLAINESDIYDLITAGGFERYSSNGFILSRKPPWFDSLYGFSFIARAVVHDVFHYNYFLMSDEQYEIEKQHSYNIIYDAINNYYLPLARKSEAIA